MEKHVNLHSEQRTVLVVPQKKKLSPGSQNFQYPQDQQIDISTNPYWLPTSGLTQMYPASFNFTNAPFLPWQTGILHSNLISATSDAMLPKPSSAKPDSRSNKSEGKKKPASQKTQKPDHNTPQPEKAAKPLSKADFPSLSGQTPTPIDADRPWLPVPTPNPKPQLVTQQKLAPKQIQTQTQKPGQTAAANKNTSKCTSTPKAPKKRNYIGRLDLELVDIPVRVAQELEKRPTPASFGLLHHNPAVRRTGAYRRPVVSDAGAAGAGDGNDGGGVAHTPKKKESKFQKIKQEYLEQVRALLAAESTSGTTPTSAIADNAFLNKIALGYSDEVKKQSDFVNSSQIRANYPVNIALREFVDNMLYPQELEKPLLSLLNKISFRYQLKKRQFPLKAKKRLVSGLKEVTRAAKSILAQSLPKLVILAVDLQRSPQEKGLDDAALDLIELLKSRGIPYVFAGTRAELGASLYGQVISSNKVKAACVALLDIQGYEAEFNNLLQIVDKAKEDFEKLVN